MLVQVKKKTRKNIQLKLLLIKLETLYFLIQLVAINNVRQVEISKSQSSECFKSICVTLKSVPRVKHKLKSRCNHFKF